MGARVKVTGIVAAVTVGLGGILWTAGEQHRQSCIREAKTGCSVLPWDQGKTQYVLRKNEGGWGYRSEPYTGWGDRPTDTNPTGGWGD